MLRLEAQEWLQMCYTPVKGKGRFERRLFLGHAIEAYQLNYVNYGCPRVCPRRLHEKSIWWAVWDLALVSACSKHRCLLIDRCPDCGKRLRWYRRAVHLCHCGADLRKLKAVPADDAVLTINAALHRAAGFQLPLCDAVLKEASFPSKSTRLGEFQSVADLLSVLGRPEQSRFLITRIQSFGSGPQIVQPPRLLLMCGPGIGAHET